MKFKAVVLLAERWIFCTEFLNMLVLFKKHKLILFTNNDRIISERQTWPQSVYPPEELSLSLTHSMDLLCNDLCSPCNTQRYGKLRPNQRISPVYSWYKHICEGLSWESIVPNPKTLHKSLQTWGEEWKLSQCLQVWTTGVRRNSERATTILLRNKLQETKVGVTNHPLRAPTLIFGLSRRPRSRSGHITSGGASEEGEQAAITQETREERTHSWPLASQDRSVTSCNPSK